jgi:hypothetical protein
MNVKATIEDFTDNFGEVEEFLKTAGYFVVAQDDIERGEFTPKHGEKIAIFHASREPDGKWSDQYFELKPNGYFSKPRGFSSPQLFANSSSEARPFILLDDNTIWARLF